jgi:alkyldihydroxyacetonephosphate synthase
MSERRRKFWGWGYEDQTLEEGAARGIARFVAGRTGTTPGAYRPPPLIGEIALAPPRIAPPPALKSLVSDTPYDRAAHSYGKSYPDYVRAFARDFRNAPDLVAFPRDENDVGALLDWAGSNVVAVIPYGAGSSVCGGVEPVVGDAFRATLSLDLGRLDRVREIDRTARAARIEAGVYGPALESQLKSSGLTLRHFPQSFEFSTLGGWIATRSGGHFATLYTHIDDLVESLRTVTPAGILESRRLPGSGAGPSPDRLIIGSEGALGVIVEAWVRLQEKPRFRASSTYFFKYFLKAAEGLRAVSQAGLFPANARLVDAEECALAGIGAGEHHLAVLTFESGDHPVEPWMARAEECLRDHGGRPAEGGARGGRDATADSWREAFIRAPFNREGLIAHGLLHDTFETAITWERLPDFHASVKSATERVIREATGRPGHVTCRFTHLYPDGPAPYFTLHATPTPGRELEEWRAIKHAASDALLAAGGTITHHHAVGRDHMPWYERQRPALFGAALAAAKQALDPHRILNPGVLVPARGR